MACLVGIGWSLGDDSFPHDKRKVVDLNVLGADNCYNAIFCSLARSSACSSPAPTATAALLATTPTITISPASLPQAAAPVPPSGPPLGLLLLGVLLLGLMLLGGWGVFAMRQRQHSAVTPPPPPV